MTEVTWKERVQFKIRYNNGWIAEASIPGHRPRRYELSGATPTDAIRRLDNYIHQHPPIAEPLVEVEDILGIYANE